MKCNFVYDTKQTSLVQTRSFYLVAVTVRNNHLSSHPQSLDPWAWLFILERSRKKLSPPYFFSSSTGWGSSSALRTDPGLLDDADDKKGRIFILCLTSVV